MKLLLLNVIAGWWDDPRHRALAADVHHLAVSVDGREASAAGGAPPPEGEFETVQLRWPAAGE